MFAVRDEHIGEFRDKAVAVDFLRNYLPSVELRGNLPVDARSVVIGGTPESLQQPPPKPDPPKKK